MFETIVGVSLAAVYGVLAWLLKRFFNLEGRVTVLETRQDPLREYIKTRFDSVEDRLDRIENKQDEN